MDDILNDECKTCGGEGFIPCPDCDGFDYKCETCNGYGEVVCPECEGFSAEGWEEDEDEDWAAAYDPEQLPEETQPFEQKSDTLVIHPTDSTTAFLQQIYAGRGFDVLNWYRGDVDLLLPKYDRIIMMGHGWTGGLFSVGKFPGSFAVGDKSVPGLKGKNNVYIWCCARTFVNHHNLDGFSTGMFISEVAEAAWFKIKTTQDVVTKQNMLFTDIVTRHINDLTVDKVLAEYVGDDPVTQFNRKQMMGINLIPREG